jgi:hypothetical protein
MFLFTLYLILYLMIGGFVWIKIIDTAFVKCWAPWLHFIPEEALLPPPKRLLMRKKNWIVSWPALPSLQWTRTLEDGTKDTWNEIYVPLQPSEHYVSVPNAVSKDGEIISMTIRILVSVNLESIIPFQWKDDAWKFLEYAVASRTRTLTSTLISADILHDFTEKLIEDLDAPHPILNQFHIHNVSPYIRFTESYIRYQNILHYTPSIIEELRTKTKLKDSDIAQIIKMNIS